MSTKSDRYIQQLIQDKVMKDLCNFQHFVGCDVSKATIDVAFHERGKDYRTFSHIKVSNNLDGFRAMRKWLKENGIKTQDIVIGMEYTGLYSEALAEWCEKQRISFVLLHPADVKNACSRGRNKTDKADAQFIADYVYTQREKLATSHPETPLIKNLRRLMSERRLAVKSRASYKILLKGIDDRSAISRIKKVIKDLDTQVKEIEKAMRDSLASDEGMWHNYELLVSVPGIGFINAVATIIATGNFTRFQTSRQYAKFICVSPLARESGTSVRGGWHVSKAGHSALKALLTEGARSAVSSDSQMKDYYMRKKKEGKSHGCIMNAVKFKLICRMFAVIKRQTAYVDIQSYRV